MKIPKSLKLPRKIKKEIKKGFKNYRILENNSIMLSDYYIVKLPIIGSLNLKRVYKFNSIKSLNAYINFIQINL